MPKVENIHQGNTPDSPNPPDPLNPPNSPDPPPPPGETLEGVVTLESYIEP
jgi:hypothetical protein